MGFAAFGFLFNMTTVLMLYIRLSTVLARINFCSLLHMHDYFNFFIFTRDKTFKSSALKYHLSDMDSMKKDL